MEPLFGHNIRQAELTEFEFVICLLLTSNPILPQNIFCSGTLISHKFILTADHCFLNLPESGFQIHLGSINIYNGTTHFAQWWITYTQWTISKNKNRRYRDNDIAILKLIIDATQITPAVVSSVPHKNVVGADAEIAGWGRRNNGEMAIIMETVKLKIISNKECSELGTMLQQKRFFVTHAEICSIAHPFAHLESGDSGGPLLIGDVIIGVNIGKCPDLNGTFNAEKANIHASVYFYRHFIVDATQQ
ncbi:PREDICTED: brachyurin-like [Ceratosolen solmsi marchali]|uniref:Brachyurin-like n=1 Tax=Ceratosolen solmsi marchali TaxID=326594 RepID=A0AAJ6YCM7_9HYME|nr:PREDICTED: brachyurin-like [Ceratosolen solmsi marchali]